MKNSIIIYILSLVLLIAAIVLIVEYSDSQRLHVVAGGMTALGLLLNILAYAIKKGK